MNKYSPEHYRDNVQKVEYSHLKSSEVGAISELLVCKDLMLRGYSVYRAVDHGSNVDLMAYKGKERLTVQVKTATLYKGSFQYKPVTNQDHDILAIVSPIGIIYQPELEYLK